MVFENVGMSRVMLAAGMAVVAAILGIELMEEETVSPVLETVSPVLETVRPVSPVLKTVSPVLKTVSRVLEMVSPALETVNLFVLAAIGKRDRVVAESTFSDLFG